MKKILLILFLSIGASTMAFAKNEVKHPPKKTKMFKLTSVTFSCCVTRMYDIPETWTQCDFNAWKAYMDALVCCPPLPDA